MSLEFPGLVLMDLSTLCTVTKTIENLKQIVVPFHFKFSFRIYLNINYHIYSNKGPGCLFNFGLF